MFMTAISQLLCSLREYTALQIYIVGHKNSQLVCNLVKIELILMPIALLDLEMNDIVAGPLILSN